MSDFDLAIPTILQHEGLLVNDPTDPGGITNYGISLRYLKRLVEQDPQSLMNYCVDHQGIIDAIDIREMSQQQAIEIYKAQWWDRYNYSAILDQRLATKVFDLSVNMGSHAAHKLLQISCNNIAGKECLAVDGVLGARSIVIINNSDAATLLLQFKAEAVQYYRQLADRKTILKKFLHGWLNRVAHP
jgi:lysozyme family protein